MNNNNNAARIVTPSPRPTSYMYVPDVIGSAPPSSSHPAPPRYAIGQHIKKTFHGFGVFVGVITRLPARDLPYYRIHYPRDSDEEDIHQDEIHKYIWPDATIGSTCTRSTVRTTRRTTSSLSHSRPLYWAAHSKVVPRSRGV